MPEEYTPTKDEAKAIALARARSDKAFRDFFVAMGYAISRWAHVYRTLFDFCRSAFKQVTLEHPLYFIGLNQSAITLR
jgi:hypothetical protein